jgi:hypothetical protein
MVYSCIYNWGLILHEVGEETKREVRDSEVRGVKQGIYWTSASSEAIKLI